MKVIAFQSDETAIVSMKVRELINVAGYESSSGFNDIFGSASEYGDSANKHHKAKLIGIHDIPVSQIFKDARDVLAAYTELRTKMESVRNQLTFLTTKMAETIPEEEA